jgi:hypothetical protein
MKTVGNACDACSGSGVEKITGGKCVSESTNILETAGDTYLFSYALILCFVTLLL